MNEGDSKMSRSSMPVSVILSENGWRAILKILHPVCQARGGDWIRWEQEVSKIILTAIEETRAAELTPGPVRAAKTYGPWGPICPFCGRTMTKSSTDGALSSHIYECSRCGETTYVQMSREERIAEGDYGFLEDWEMGMEDDL